MQAYLSRCFSVLPPVTLFSHPRGALLDGHCACASVKLLVQGMEFEISPEYFNLMYVDGKKKEWKTC